MANLVGIHRATVQTSESKHQHNFSLKVVWLGALEKCQNFAAPTVHCQPPLNSLVGVTLLRQTIQKTNSEVPGCAVQTTATVQHYLYTSIQWSATCQMVLKAITERYSLQYIHLQHWWTGVSIHSNYIHEREHPVQAAPDSRNTIVPSGPGGI